MGNTSGVNKVGMTLAEVVPVLRLVCDRDFPGVFEILPPGNPDNGVGVRIADAEWRGVHKNRAYFLVWFQEDDVVGGNSPHSMGPFGYWIRDVLMYGVANEMDADPYDDGAGVLPRKELPLPPFSAYVSKHYRMTVDKCIETFDIEAPPSLLPWLV